MSGERSQAGLTLVEVVAAVALGSLLVVAVGGFLGTLWRSSRTGIQAGLILSGSQRVRVELARAARGAVDADLSADGRTITFIASDGTRRTFAWNPAAEEIRDETGRLIGRFVTGFTANKVYPAGMPVVYPNRATISAVFQKVVIDPVVVTFDLAGFRTEVRLTLALRGVPEVAE